MTIFCDMDGVVANIIDEWIECYNKDYNDNLCVDNLNDYNIEECVKPECGKKIFDYIKMGGFFLNAKVYERSIEILSKLSNCHIIYFATTVPYSKTALHEKREWVERYFPFIGKNKVISIRDKYLLRGDVLIEDTPVKLENFRGDRILINRPWNKSSNGGYFRAEDWNHVYDILMSINNIGGCE